MSQSKCPSEERPSRARFPLWATKRETMSDKQSKKRMWLFALTALTLALITAACAGDAPPTPEPSPIPKPTNAPQPTDTPQPTATPQPAGVIDTGMGGTLSVQGVIKDSSGQAIPGIDLFITAYEEDVHWDRTGESYNLLGDWKARTDKTGIYAFNNLAQVVGGHHQIWLSGAAEDGQAYENSGYYIIKKTDEDARTLFKEMGFSHFTYHPDESGDTYELDIVMHPVSGSAFSGVVWYEDADGTTKNYFASPLDNNHGIELNRGTDPANHEYTVGNQFTSDGSEGYMGDLAGGMYYLMFQFIRSDGMAAGCMITDIEIPPGETKQFDLTIPADACEIFE
ncbi:MAG: hypothetical protein GY803_12100 [Chloroflexi bacterium]|nr:hypothetical protein [Chloroflexota bacterium]